MRGNRRSGTKPEVRVRSLLHRRGLRFRKDMRLDLPDGRVRPDIVFPRAKVAVFIDGCFWHGCPDHSAPPRVNQWYWGPKLQRNRERDGNNDRALHSAGWLIIRAWEHEPAEAIADAVASAYRQSLTAQSRRRRVSS